MKELLLKEHKGLKQLLKAIKKASKKTDKNKKFTVWRPDSIELM